MSVSMYEHSIFGLLRIYIEQDKWVMQIRVNQVPQQWLMMEKKLKQSQSGNIIYYFLPQKIYSQPYNQLNYEQNQSIHYQQPIIKIFYQKYLVTLHEQIHRRSQNSQFFSINQIVYLCYTILCASLEILYYNNQYLTNNFKKIPLSLHSFLIDEFGSVKVVGQLSCPSFDNQSMNKKQFSSYDENNQNTNTSKETETSLSLKVGVIFAQIMTLKSDQCIWNPSNKNLILQRQFYDWFLPAKNNYDSLWRMVKLMVSNDTQTRLKISEFKALLHPYEQNIINGQDFYLNSDKSYNSLLQYLMKQTTNN